MIKLILTFFLLLIFKLNIQAQEKKSPMFFNELYISGNQSFSYESFNLLNGYGLSFLKTFEKKEHFHFVTGISFNKTAYFTDYVYDGHYANKKDVSFNFYDLYIPLLIRNQFGKRLKTFLDYGLNVQIPIGGGESGTSVISIPYFPSGIQSYKTRANHDINAYLTAGIGVKFPIREYQLIFKSSLNYGIFGYDIGAMETLRNHFLNVSLGIRKK
jgi:hypothetical protein